MFTASSLRPALAGTAAVLTLFATTALALAAPSAAASNAPRSDRTSPVEARRVDRVPTPKLDWSDCSAVFAPGDECTTATVPLDYDQPSGPTTRLALLRLKATDQAHRIGTLFVNPGGPGGSGVAFASLAPLYFSPAVLARFDVVGFDPRGTNFSDEVRCFTTTPEQQALTGPLFTDLFPWTPQETRAYTAAARNLGRACSSTGRPLSGSMSTAEVARDLDVLRRAVGDPRLTYFGASYGSYLGNVYANLFPDRVRALVIDGVLDPLAWAGTPDTAPVPMSVRIKSGEASYRAMHELLARCAKAGPDVCTFARLGDPEATYARLVASLQRTPLSVPNPDGGPDLTVRYSDLVAALTQLLYLPNGYRAADVVLTSIATLVLEPAAPAGSAAQRRRDAAAADLAAGILDHRSKTAAAAVRQQGRAAVFGLAEAPYVNALDAQRSVMCTDSVNPADVERWRAFAAVAQHRTPDFGLFWTWWSAPCASRTWTVQDEDAYRGPFTHRTAAPVLVVGNYWDPATNYDGAVAAAGLLPNSRLLSSDSWGHTAYNTSACVTTAVNTYLLTQAVPAKGTTCVGDVQPFAPAASGRAATSTKPQLGDLLPEGVPGTPRW